MFASALLFSTPLLATEPKSSPDLDEEKVLYVVGYAHLDTQWRWDFATTIEHYIPATLRKNFELFDKYDSYIFNFTGSARFEMMEEYYPQDFEKLKGYVEENRFRVVGSSVDEGDVNVPSAEALLRQVLYGNGYFRRTFNREGIDYMLPDCFGFPASVPSILAHCGLKGFVTQKLTWGSAVGIPFNVGVWEGPDGNSVVAVLNPGAYVHRLRNDLSEDPSWLERVEQLGEDASVFTDYHFYGVGDRGGAPDEESVKWLEKSVSGKGPLKVISASSDQIFRDLTEEQISRLPRYKGDMLLTEHSAGTLTSQAYMKRWNRKNELLADAAERASVMAEWLGGATYPKEKMEKMWVRVLLSQMHDILPGTSIPKAYEYSWNDEVLALNGFSRILTNAMGAVAQSLDTRVEGTPILVFNPLSIPREDIVQARVTVSPGKNGIDVRDPSGIQVPAQMKRVNDTTFDVTFLAKVPALGASVFDVRELDAPATIKSELSVTTNTLENTHYRVTLNSQGDVAQIYDKKLGKDLLSSPARLLLLRDAPAQWPAWNMDWKDLQAEPAAIVSGPAKITIVEDGPARVSLSVTRDVLGSRIVQRIRLSAGKAGDRLEFDNEIEWSTKGYCLKAEFPLTASNSLATYNPGMGTIQRSTNHEKKYEVPSHEWFDLTHDDGTFGVTVIEDCKFGSDKPDDSTLRLTLLRTPEAKSYLDQATQDLGMHEMTYGIAGHRGDWREGNAPWLGSRLNQPLLAFQPPKHDGPSGRSLSFLALNTNRIAVRAVKKAEVADEIIVRVQELAGYPVKGATLGLLASITSARETDGQERSIGSAKLNHGSLVFDMEPYGLKTFALTLTPHASTAVLPASEPATLPFNCDVLGLDGEKNGGSMDQDKRCYPGEMLPAKLQCEGITFKLGSSGSGIDNAVSCQGQKIQLPEGDHDLIYLLAASSDIEKEAIFRVGETKTALTVQNWTGYIGQWDNRQWNKNEMIGLAPGFIKRDPVAWFSTHRHSDQGDNDPYQFSYLFLYSIAKETGEKELVLPSNPDIKILAMSVATNPNEATRPAQHLYDTLEMVRSVSPPYIAKDEGSYGSGLFLQEVKIELASVTEGSTIFYTLDGTDPDQSKTKYQSPIQFAEETEIRARAFKEGQPSSVVFSQRFTRTTPLPAGEFGEVVPGIDFEYYEEVDLRKLPDFDELVPKKTGAQKTIGIQARRRDDDISFRFRGFIRIEDTAVYTFFLSSDDGSKLKINGETIIDHDGLHGASDKKGYIALEQGLHALEVTFFERGGDEALTLEIQGPGLARNPIPESMLFRSRQ